jgi:hypothetical protein
MVAKSNLAPREPRDGEARSLLGVERGVSPVGALELDRLIHERMRLAMVSSLAVNETLSFNEL